MSTTSSTSSTPAGTAGVTARATESAVVLLATDRVDEVMAIDAPASRDPWSRTLWIDELSRADRRYLGVVQARPGGAGQVLTAFAGWVDLAGEAHVMNVGVAPDARRRGLGVAVLVALLDDVATAGIDAVTLEVRRSNTAGRALYRRVGFEEAGIRPGYYPDGEDAVILWRR